MQEYYVLTLVLQSKHTTFTITHFQNIIRIFSNILKIAKQKIALSANFNKLYEESQFKELSQFCKIKLDTNKFFFLLKTNMA